ncbi:ribonuclease R [Natronohydrobacter thiooxidans]|uniref:ribonuclease R n=1 Tax=Natronohydrobacter thiooxidans TaxID=87172 RepID=UPI0008FF2D55|nr:ribonuclease R [Natronohydrobacter thiooxidans]
MKQLPSLDQLRDWIAENPGATRREIAQAFGIKGSLKIDLKAMLRELEVDGTLKPRRSSAGGKLPPVTVLDVLAPDAEGDLFARPVEWRGDGAAPVVLIVSQAGDPALGQGDRILAKLDAIRGPDYDYQARIIRKLGANPSRILGIFRKEAQGGRIVPIDKGADKIWQVAETGDAVDGELVHAEPVGKSRFGPLRAKVIERLGDPTAPKAVSLIAIHQHGIRDEFPDVVIAEADKAGPVSEKGRRDLRALPLMTIDPWDARDHDDAIYAEADTDPENPGGFILWVAIADVAAYVRPNSELDREARRRGNSTYFPDRVVPMLPDILSGDLCSLHEGVDRPCIALRMVIAEDGSKRSHEFCRAMMTSKASLTYEQAQAADAGRLDEVTAPFAQVLADLFAAYRALSKARARRQPLDLDLPERQIVLSDEGRVTSVAFKERFDAHRLVEEFMVLANVAAAETLREKGSALLYRVHEEPSPEKMDALRELARESGFALAKGQVLMTRHFNQLLKQAEGTEFDELINMATLRSMTQAYYAPQNFGHFGLALGEYAHFTSPIRRYADLIVHRGLISAHRWGDDGLSPWDIEHLEDTAKAISEAERRSMAAERDTADRYLAAYLADRVGAEFTGRVSGVARFGVFVKLDETGADGLVPIRAIGDEYFRHDPEAQVLEGEKTGFRIGLGQRVKVKLAEAEPVTGGIALELLEVEGEAPARSHGRRRKGPVRRAVGKSRAGTAKAKKKLKRKR